MNSELLANSPAEALRALSSPCVSNMRGLNGTSAEIHFNRSVCPECALNPFRV
jgi:hypothetical protein